MLEPFVDRARHGDREAFGALAQMAGDRCMAIAYRILRDVGLAVDGAAFWFQTNEHHRIYAIPTGADTIIAVTWGNDFGGAGEEFLNEMNAATDDIVRSMDFE